MRLTAIRSARPRLPRAVLDARPCAECGVCHVGAGAACAECEARVQAELAELVGGWAELPPVPSSLEWSEEQALSASWLAPAVPVVDHAAALARAECVAFANAAARVASRPSADATVRP